MASRDIANMHFFLDLKKKFPDLPDDILRSHVSLFSEDQEKCISLLQKESKNHHHVSSQPFSDFRLPEGKANNGKLHPMRLDLSGTTSTTAKPESRSAPVVPDKEPFSDTMCWGGNSTSSHQNSLCHPPSQTMFSTTKEHRVGIPDEPRTSFMRGLSEPSGRHTVRLSIMPSMPFQQQQQPNPRSGRHTTSVNVQLQPRLSDQQRPFVISAIPAGEGGAGSNSRFQISVGSQGATFTALRFQHAEGSLQVSSQAQNSYSPLPPNSGAHRQNSSTLFRTAHASPNYILAVKNQQIARLDSILNELEKEKAKCSRLRAEVSQLEQVAENNNKDSNVPFSFAEKLNELREENKRLRTECNCLYIENDTYVPPLETEDFYSHIFTGPNGAILPHTKEASSVPQREEEDERSQWVCKKCTFANHPALEVCELCELPKDSFFDCN